MNDEEINKYCFMPLIKAINQLIKFKFVKYDANKKEIVWINPNLKTYFVDIFTASIIK